MKATMHPDTGTVTVELTNDEWQRLSYWAVPWDDLTVPEADAVRAFLKTVGQPEGYQGP